MHKRSLETLKNVKYTTCKIKRYLSHDHIYIYVEYSYVEYTYCILIHYTCSVYAYKCNPSHMGPNSGCWTRSGMAHVTKRAPESIWRSARTHVWSDKPTPWCGKSPTSARPQNKQPKGFTGVQEWETLKFQPGYEPVLQPPSLCLTATAFDLSQPPHLFARVHLL